MSFRSDNTSRNENASKEFVSFLFFSFLLRQAFKNIAKKIGVRMCEFPAILGTGENENLARIPSRTSCFLSKNTKKKSCSKESQISLKLLLVIGSFIFPLSKHHWIQMKGSRHAW